MVTLQDPVPTQAPLHPVNVDPDAADAVRVTFVPMGNGTDWEHATPQETPPGLDITFPLPFPVTVRLRTGSVKVAVTF